MLKKKLWKVFAEYIKKRDKNICFTCGRRAEGQGYHAGHYIAKSICGLALYFDERNVHGQCFHCNINLGGNGRIYERKMLKKYGKKVVKELDKMAAQKITKWSKQDYLDKIAFYQEKLKKYDLGKTTRNIN